MKKAIAIILCAIFIVPVMAAAMGSVDKYSDAQTALAFTVYKPNNTLGLSASKFLLISCGVGGEKGVYAKYGGSNRYLEITQTTTGVKCSNRGLTKQLKNVSINGISAKLYVYCDLTKPAASAKCGTKDIVRVGGYLIFTNEAAKNLQRTEIQVQAIGGITYSQLLSVAKSLKSVVASGKVVEPSPASSDLVLSTPTYLPKPPAGGSDEYRCFLLDPKFKDGAYLQSVTITPDNLKVSHHGILYKVSASSVSASQSIDAQSSEPGWPCFGDTGIPGASSFSAASPSSWISFWAPGGNFKAYPAGTGMQVNAGDQFILQSHFNLISAGNDSENTAAMKVTLELSKTPVEKLQTLLIAAPIEIPCGPNESGPLCSRAAALADLARRTSDKAVQQGTGLLFICGKDPIKPVASPISECTSSVRSPIKIYGATGHMHQLGRSITITYLNASTNSTTVLSSRPIWNFDNQKTDWQSTPIMAMPGDILKVSCTFDVGLRALLPEFRNISPNYIVWGEGTRDEMCLAIINYTN